ncbi:MAG TPA: cytidine deaminase [Bellilinea sp.]|nr:cytidine deaminase [Bellilinea sp.]
MILNPEQRQQLVEAAIKARLMAYAPYSQYKVGAAVLSSSGRVFTGANVENAAYPTTMCAERVAIFKAVSEGERDFAAIAVVTSNAGMSCGGCRQVMAEFGLDTLVLIADDQGKIAQELTVRDLLPGAFTPKDLPRA